MYLYWRGVRACELTIGGSLGSGRDIDVVADIFNHVNCYESTINNGIHFLTVLLLHSPYADLFFHDSNLFINASKSGTIDEGGWH